MCMHCAYTLLKKTLSSKDPGYAKSMRHTVSYCHPYTVTLAHIYASSFGDLCNISRWMSQRFAVLNSPKANI